MCGVTALIAFGLFLVLNFWPGWSAMPIFSQEMRMNIGMVDMALWSLIVFNVAFLFADTKGLRLTGHLIIAMAMLLAFTTLLQDFPFALSAGLWSNVVHWVLVLGVVVSFLTIPATWWGMVAQSWEGPARRPRRRVGRHRHAS